MMSADSISRLVSVAMGEAPADLILEDCRLFSVYTGEIIPETQIAVSDGRIAYVGPDASHARGPATRIINAGGRHVGPGFADPHIHIDQFVMPSEFAKEALLCGVTTLFSDPIDVVSVAGRRGFDEFLRLGRGLPIRIFQTVPGGLPVDPMFSRRGSGSMIARQRTATRDADVPGMGEVFSWTKVTGRDAQTMQSISEMLERNCIINGHTAGASGRKLGAYVASGIISCHEPINFEQAIERLRLGMWVMVREGSIRRDLAEIISRVISNRTYLDRLMFCSDGLDPSDIRRFGHIDYCVQQAVSLGLRPVDAVTIATRNTFDYYGMSGRLGGVAPGRLADILIFGDIAKSYRPQEVLVGGRQVVSGGRLAVSIPSRRFPSWLRHTVKAARVSAHDFAVRLPAGAQKTGRGGKSRHSDCEIVANTICLKTEIVTGLGSARLAADGDGRVIVPPDASDLWKVAAFDRIEGTKKRCVAFLEGLGGSVGAFGSTWSFHENDMIIIGSDDAEMARVANYLVQRQGGIAVAQDKKITASLPLQFAGIVSTAPFARVLEEFGRIGDALADSGCRLARPLLVPLFLPFLALPAVRITSGGLVDVKGRRYVAPVQYLP